MPDDINGKLDEVLKRIGENSQSLESIKTLLIGDVKDSGKIGILERLRKVEEWIQKREWFEKVIIIAVVGNIVGLVFLLIRDIGTK